MFLYRCDQGWEGDDCEINSNLCKNCLNGGTCVVANRTTKCHCVQGWTGTYLLNNANILICRIRLYTFL